jgi:hypothetical protein
MAAFSAKELRDAPVRVCLEPAPYHIRIMKAKAIKSSQKGTDGIEFDLQVVSGPIQSNRADPMNRHIFSQIFSSNEPANRGPFFSKMKALALATGFDFESVPEDIDDETFQQMLLDYVFQRECIVQIDNETYKGEKREKIVTFKALP